MKLDPEALEAAREVWKQHHAPAEIITAYLIKLAEKATHLDLATGEGVRAERVGSVDWDGSDDNSQPMLCDTLYYAAAIGSCRVGEPLFSLTPITQADTPET